MEAVNNIPSMTYRSAYLLMVSGGLGKTLLEKVKRGWLFSSAAQILQNYSWYQRAATPRIEASRNVSHRGTILETATSMSGVCQETARDGGERKSGK